MLKFTKHLVICRHSCLTPSNTKMAAEMFEKLSNLFTSSVTVKAEEDDEEEESEEEEEVTLNIVTCKV